MSDKEIKSEKELLEKLEEYNKALEINPMNTVTLGHKARLLFKLERNQAALNIYSKLLTIDPDNTIAWNGKWRVLRVLKSYDEAIRCYDEAIKLDPNYSAAWNNKAFVLNQLERYDEALDNYNEALELNPKNSIFWNNKGKVLNQLERYNEALDSYNEALELNSKNSIFWNNKGDVLYWLERYDEALDSYNEALELNPKNSIFWNNKGNTFRQLERYKEALVAYDSALEINPKDPTILCNKGAILDDLKYYEEAITVYNKSLEIDPKNSVTWCNKGTSLFSLNRYEEALVAYNNALEINPKDSKIWMNKIEVLKELWRYSEAQMTYKRLATNIPELEGYALEEEKKMALKEKEKKEKTKVSLENVETEIRTVKGFDNTIKLLSSLSGTDTDEMNQNESNNDALEIISRQSGTYLRDTFFSKDGWKKGQMPVFPICIISALWAVLFFVGWYVFFILDKSFSILFDARVLFFAFFSVCALTLLICLIRSLSSSWFRREERIWLLVIIMLFGVFISSFIPVGPVYRLISSIDEKPPESCSESLSSSGTTGTSVIAAFSGKLTSMTDRISCTGKPYVTQASSDIQWNFSFNNTNSVQKVSEKELKEVKEDRYWFEVLYGIIAGQTAMTHIKFTLFFLLFFSIRQFGRAKKLRIHTQNRLINVYTYRSFILNAVDSKKTIFDIDIFSRSASPSLFPENMEARSKPDTVVEDVMDQTKKMTSFLEVVKFGDNKSNSSESSVSSNKTEDENKWTTSSKQ